MEKGNTMGLYEENKEILKKYDLFAQKKYGQNFLIDDFALVKIINSADISKEDLIIEIGPGLGNLTKRLCEKAGQVVAIEIDKNMVKILKEEYNHLTNLTIINEDVMKSNLNEIVSNYKGLGSVKVVANLPYYITTPIIMKLLESELNIELIEVMVQKEVALRLCATPTGKEYGAITVAVNYYSEPKYIATVPSTSFFPEPNVDSAIVLLKLLKEPIVSVNKDLMFDIVKKSFSQKRKTLLNSLGNACINEVDKERLANILNELGIDLQIRAERLSLKDFADISNKYSELEK